MIFLYFIPLIVILIFLFITFVLARISYKKIFEYHFINKEDRGTFLNEKEYTFSNKKGYLKGYLYENKNSNKLIIFAHGLLSEHKNYMTIYERLYQEGYSVFTFDGTGAGKSSGKGIKSLYQAVEDLKVILKEINTWDEYEEIALIGHSLGAYSITMLSKEYKEKVKKVIAFSGFKDRKEILNKTSMNRIPKFLKWCLMPWMNLFETLAHPIKKDEVYLNIQDTKNIHYFFLHSLDDHVVPYSCSLAEICIKHPLENVKVFTIDKRGHNGILYSSSCNEYRNRMHHQFHEMKKGKNINFSEFKKQYIDTSLYEVFDEEIITLIKDFLEK